MQVLYKWREEEGIPNSNNLANIIIFMKNEMQCTYF